MTIKTNPLLAGKRGPSGCLYYPRADGTYAFEQPTRGSAYFAFMDRFGRAPRAAAEVGLGALVTESHGVTELRLYGAIGQPFGISPLDVAKAIDEHQPDVVRLNSPGGDVFDGMAIANSIAQAGLPVVVDGVAASIASIIAVRGTRLTMLAGSHLMIHKPWSMPVGNADDLRAEAAILDKLGATMADVYAQKAGKGDRKRWLAAMGAESWYSAADALANGLADVADEEPAPGIRQARAFALDTYLPRVRAALLGARP